MTFELKLDAAEKYSLFNVAKLTITNSLLINESSDSCKAAQGQYASCAFGSIRRVREFRRILSSTRWWLSRPHLDELALTNTCIKFIESVVIELR